MTKVLLIGATGYVGKTVADTLVRSGQHEVWGIARSESKAKQLALGEVRPVLSPDPVNQPAPWVDAIRHNHIDVVVDASTASRDQEKVFALVKTLGTERIERNKAPGGWGACGPKLGYIMTSGTWLYGNRHTRVNELDDIGVESGHNPASPIAWRPDFDKTILAARDVLDVALIRPALIYGREGTIWTTFILPLLEASRKGVSVPVEVPLDANSRPALIHIDDVASGYQLAIEIRSIDVECRDKHVMHEHEVRHRNPIVMIGSRSMGRTMFHVIVVLGIEDTMNL